MSFSKSNSLGVSLVISSSSFRRSFHASAQTASSASLMAVCSTT